MRSYDELKQTPLLLAISSDQSNLVDEILTGYISHQLDINLKDIDGKFEISLKFTNLHSGNTALHYAVQNCTSQSLLSFLRFKFLHVDIKNLRQNTPLHYFCQKFCHSNPEEPLRKIIERGVQVNSQNHFGETPLHLAMLNSSADAMIAISKVIK